MRKGGKEKEAKTKKQKNWKKKKTCSLFQQTKTQRKKNWKGKLFFFFLSLFHSFCFHHILTNGNVLCTHAPAHYRIQFLRSRTNLGRLACYWSWFIERVASFFLLSVFFSVEQTKGTSSQGKHLSKSHTICRRCHKRSYHIQKSTCASCGYPNPRKRTYNWGAKSIRRRTTGTGRMRYLKTLPRKFKNGFIEGAWILLFWKMFYSFIYENNFFLFFLFLLSFAQVLPPSRRRSPPLNCVC